jgi:hypothetical protein
MVTLFAFTTGSAVAAAAMNAIAAVITVFPDAIIAPLLDDAFYHVTVRL